MSIYEFQAQTIDGSTLPLSQYQGKVLLVVNTASKCGFTPQFKDLQALYETYKDQGFEILGFPCNQFGSQEPGNSEEIKNFCSLKYDVSFPMFSKIDVNGSETHPLYKYLKAHSSSLFGKRIKWNFTKFLVDANGNVVNRFAPTKTPLQLKSEIEALLKG